MSFSHPMQKIGIFYNPALFKTLDELKNKIEILNNNKCKVFLLESQERKGLEGVSYIEDFTHKDIDLLMVFGGDGTILRASKLVLSENIPLLGFNHGKLGFLSECEKHEFDPVLKQVINDDFRIEERTMLDCSYPNKDNHKHALNDCVLHKGKYPRMLTFKIFRNDEFLFDIESDGLIISSPTGSTAYNISAGGSIAFPHTNVILLTAINPHNQFIKPLILPDNDLYTIIYKKGNNKVFLIIDGEEIGQVRTGESIVVSKSNFTAKFVKLSNKSFAHILRKKFFV